MIPKASRSGLLAPVALRSSTLIPRRLRTAGSLSYTWYIEVRYFDRFPVDSASTFKLGDQVQIENAEGVIARQIPTVTPPFRRSARRSASSSTIIAIDDEQIQKLNDVPLLDAM